MNHSQQTARRVLVGCAVATVALSAVSAVSAAQSNPADAKGDVENIPAVPVRVLRPDAADPQKQKVDPFTRAVPASPDRIGRSGNAAAADGPGYRMNENHVIRMQPGENVFIPIAVNHPNRIVTPFRNPQVVSTTLTSNAKSGECGEICVRDSVVYVSTDKTYPVTAFITEGGREDIALSVTMMPRQVPPREVKLTVPEEVMKTLRSDASSAGGSQKAAAWEASQPYVETIRTAFRTVALGSVPQGYVLRKVKNRDALPVCNHPGAYFEVRK